MAKALVSYSFSKRESKANKPNRPELAPNPDHKIMRCVDHMPLRKDSYGNYYILSPSKTGSPTLIRDEVPFEYGYWLMSIDDSMLTSDQKPLTL